MGSGAAGPALAALAALPGWQADSRRAAEELRLGGEVPPKRRRVL